MGLGLLALLAGLAPPELDRLAEGCAGEPACEPDTDERREDDGAVGVGGGFMAESSVVPLPNGWAEVEATGCSLVSWENLNEEEGVIEASLRPLSLA